MFWAEARRQYAGVTADDADVRRYLEISSQIQQSGYGGITGLIQDMGHRWIAARTPPGPTLEIGFGAGRHNLFYAGDREEYFVSEYSSSHFGSEQWKKVRGRGLQCDARNLPFGSGKFKSVISIYNLEHIEELGKVLKEVHRVLSDDGVFLVALPCEGGLAWNLGRELTTRRQVSKTYGINYDKIIAFEHVRDLRGVLAELVGNGHFRMKHKRLFPFLVPSVDLNLVACLECRKR